MKTQGKRSKEDLCVTIDFKKRKKQDVKQDQHHFHPLNQETIIPEKSQVLAQGLYLSQAKQILIGPWQVTLLLS